MSTIQNQSSPVAIQPLHNPAQAAYVTHPAGPLKADNNSIAPNVPAGTNALLAKKDFKARYLIPFEPILFIRLPQNSPEYTIKRQAYWARSVAIEQAVSTSLCCSVLGFNVSFAETHSCLQPIA